MQKPEIIKFFLNILLLFQGQRYEHVTIYLNTISCLVLCFHLLIIYKNVELIFRFRSIDFENIHGKKNHKICRNLYFNE